MNLRMIWFLLSLLLVGLLASAPAARAAGRGVVRLPAAAGIEGFAPLNPLYCTVPLCDDAVDLLFPALLHVDPTAHVFAPATADDGLAASWEISDDLTVYTFRLRADRRWSDGTPITAYDVFFSYVARLSFINARRPPVAPVRGVVVVDDTTLEFWFDNDVGCDALVYAQMRIAPAHALHPGFKEEMAAFFAALPRENDTVTRWLSWRTAYAGRSFSVPLSHPFNTAPTVTAGPLRFVERQATQFIRLGTPDGALVVEYVPVPDGEVTAFLRGDVDALYSADVFNVLDVSGVPGAQVFSVPSSYVFYLTFNLADPADPQPAFNVIDDAPVPQGTHPLTGDPAVRRALALATDRAGFQDALPYLTPADGFLPPLAWAHDPAFAAPGYDVTAAQVLLENAGWKDTDGDGVRECRGCASAADGTPLYLTLTHDSGTYSSALALALARQWALAGIGVNAYADDGYAMSSQQYDAHLGLLWMGYPALGDLLPLVSPLFDVPGDYVYSNQSAWSDFNTVWMNSASYNRDAVTDALMQARTLPGCAPDARAALYQQAQRTLAEDGPFLWLAVYNYQMVVRPEVQGADPRPFAPLWNIADWVTWRGQ